MVLSLSVQSETILASGRFESFGFDFVAKSPKDLNSECINFATKLRIAHIDDIYVSFNGNKRLHLHNSEGVWHYPKHFCAQLESTAQSIDMSPPSPSEFKEVQVLIRNGDYKFVGSHEAEIFNDCISQLESSSVSEIDYIRARVVGERWFTLRNNDGWWQGAQKVCTLIDQAVFQQDIRRSPAVVNLNYSKSPL